MARERFSAFEGAGLDGVVGKRLAGPYVQNKREMIKIKHKRTADCVVIGYPDPQERNGSGVDVARPAHRRRRPAHGRRSSAFSDAKRIELQQLLEPMRLDPDKPAMGEQTRWRSGKDGAWIPVRPELVVESAYDQMENHRFRHTVKFMRWRPDREPRAAATTSWRFRSPTTCTTCWKGTEHGIAVSRRELDVDGIAVRLSNPDKIYFPGLGENGGRKGISSATTARWPSPGPMLSAVRDRPTFIEHIPTASTAIRSTRSTSPVNVPNMYCLHTHHVPVRT